MTDGICWPHPTHEVFSMMSKKHACISRRHLDGGSSTVEWIEVMSSLHTALGAGRFSAHFGDDSGSQFRKDGLDASVFWRLNCDRKP
jgi:hypothetical protein